MELQRIIWSWEMITQRLLEVAPDIGRAIFRSCRPIAAQRYRDGRLLVVLGCWWQPDQEHLSKEQNRLRLNGALGKMLSEQVVTNIVRWPGGMVKNLPAETEDEQMPAPDVLKGLPEQAREEAAKCESAIQRLFYAKAYERGLQLRCQYPLQNYRLDFSIPERRIGVDVMGWDWRSGPSGAAVRGERQEHLEQYGWQILMFSGSQVLSDVDKCVSALVKLEQTGLAPGQRPLPTRYSSEPRKPFSTIGTHRPYDRGPKKPRR